VGATSRRCIHDGVTMPMYDRTGPRGQGPRTGWGRGYCPPMSFGQETPAPAKPVIQVERPASSAELALWDKAEKLKRRVVLKAFAMRLQYANVVKAAKVAGKHKFNLEEPELADLEVRMQATITEIDALRENHCDVTGMKLGVRTSADGKDLDIVQPPSMTFGAIWIPIAIGAVVVAGIIARWAYLETEVQTISDRFNAVLRRADEKLCADPSSPMCQDWEATKSTGGYVQNETLIDSVKKAVKTVGGFAGRGLGIGIAVAIPLLMMIYLPRPKRNGKG